MGAIIGNGSWAPGGRCGGGPEGPPPRPATAPPVGGSPGLTRYFWGRTHNVNDSSPNTNAAQLPETDISSKELPGPNVSPSATS